jgi:hypothetical protein
MRHVMFGAAVMMVGVLAGCGGTSDAVDGTKADLSAGGSPLTSVTERVFGDAAAAGVRLYFVVGANADGEPCSLSLRRNEKDSVVPNLTLTLGALGKEEKSLGVGIGVHAKVSGPNASSVTVTTTDTSDPTATDTTEFTFDGASANGLEHLTAVAIQSQSKSSGASQSLACKGTHAVLLALTESQGDALASRAKAAYEKTGKRIATVTYVNQCSLASGTQLECNFDVDGKADGDAPKLQATFALEKGAVGDIVDVKYLP